MECSRSFAIATINLYCFVFIGLSFGDTNKIREQPYSLVLILYPLRPSLTAGVLEVGLNNADNMDLCIACVYCDTVVSANKIID